jgi:hypothetical protein
MPRQRQEPLIDAASFGLLACRNVARAQKPSPKLSAIDDFEISRGSIPTTLSLDLAVATSVYAAFLSRPLINQHAAYS